jgi:predicted ribosome quality control (RQC) complex YloA/Tae2 family protein
MKVVNKKDTTYWIGKNAQDNWDIIKKSEQNWMWFHLDKFPSSHVIICKDSKEVLKEEINNACKLLIENSKYKFNNIGIVYCEISNLIIGEEVGSVRFISNRKVNKINYNE